MRNGLPDFLPVRALVILCLTAVISYLALASKITDGFVIVYAFLLCVCLAAKEQKNSRKDVDDDNC